jgi:hypothetical protein
VADEGPQRKQVIRDATTGRFLTSGNPGGRPKNGLDLSAMCRNLTPRAVERLREFIEHEDPRVALQAIKEILDRGFGRPVQPVQDDTESTSLSMLHLIAARAVAERLQSEWEAQGSQGAANGQNGSSTPPGGATGVIIDYSEPALE